MTLKEILTMGIDMGASDIHLVARRSPIVRVDGELQEVGGEVLSSKDIAHIIGSILDQNQQERLRTAQELDLVYEHDTEHRFRINAFWESGNVSAVIRLIPQTIPSLSSLGFDDALKQVTRLKDGLVLVTGPTGSGKSTTLASLIQTMNAEDSKNIITFEDPIEFIFPNGKSVIRQRQFDTDFSSFQGSLKSVVRQDPDVVMIGEMRDSDTIATTITLAETGHLVFSTLHTVSAAQTINRILDMFPAAQQAQVCLQLAMTLRCIISQRLLPKVGGGRIAAREILVNTPAATNLIREHKFEQIQTIMQTGSKDGMMTMDQSLTSLVSKGLIRKEDALFFISDKILLDR